MRRRWLAGAAFVFLTTLFLAFRIFFSYTTTRTVASSVRRKIVCIKAGFSEACASHSQGAKN
jgi:hypothetical protein